MQFAHGLGSSHQGKVQVCYCKATHHLRASCSTYICREDLDEGYDSFDEGVYCRSRSWLFLAYLVSFGSIMAAVAVLLKDYALNEQVDRVWPGVAGLFQVTLILGSGLLLFVSRTPTEGGGSASYGGF